MSTNLSELINDYCRCPNDHCVAIALCGSRARNDGHPLWSDVDAVRIVIDNEEELRNCTFCQKRSCGTHLVPIEKNTTRSSSVFLTICTVTLREATVDWFEDPKQALAWMRGIQDCVIIHDSAAPSITPGDAITPFLEGLKCRAASFSWTDDLITKRRTLAIDELEGWIEEAFKAAQGLERVKGQSSCQFSDAATVGRLLNGLHGLTFGLTYVVTLFFGVLRRGDNFFIEDLERFLLSDSGSGIDAALRAEWCRKSAETWGVTPNCNLVERARSGLQLFLLTCRLLGEDARSRPTIAEAARRIEENCV